MSSAQHSSRAERWKTSRSCHITAAPSIQLHRVTERTTVPAWLMSSTTTVSLVTVRGWCAAAGRNAWDAPYRLEVPAGVAPEGMVQTCRAAAHLVSVARRPHHTSCSHASAAATHVSFLQRGRHSHIQCENIITHCFERQGHTHSQIARDAQQCSAKRAHVSAVRHISPGFV